MNDALLSAIAERSFLLRGPTERTVTIKIGIPESDPQHPDCSRCPFQVLGLSDDSVQYAIGVDSFQALNLAFSGIRGAFIKNASVLAAFHEDFSLTWEGTPWEVALPLGVNVNDLEQHNRFMHFMNNEFWRKCAKADA